MSVRDEILEQPAVARGLLGAQLEPIARIREAVLVHRPESIVIAARGTSDHAAIYAQYLFGVLWGVPVALAAPSLLSLYDAELRFGARSLVIGISQSGVSPDVVGVVAAAHRQNVPTIAITNSPGSPLWEAAGHQIDLGAGKERSIAATKTFTASLVAIAMLAGAAGLDAVPDALTDALAVEAEARDAAAALAGVETCTVLGRGFGYATAREWALKLKELAGVMADPYSAADFQHGPLALVDPGDHVLVVAPSGATAASIGEAARHLREALGAHLLVLSDDPGLRAIGQRSLASPFVAESLAPIVQAVPAQLFALHLARAKGRDPERPRHITKVTATR